MIHKYIQYSVKKSIPTIFGQLFLLALFLQLSIANDEQRHSPIIQTNYGLIQGLTFIEENLTINAFYGIPYAEKPIGFLRFERPRPPAHWDGILSTKYAPPPCPPHARSNSIELLNNNYSEDCLYLNIFTGNHLKNQKKRLPVVFAIHGGSYQNGSAAFYSDYHEIGSKFISCEIVFVAIQFRLGFMGFASTGDNIFAGNYGLWDQTEALRFVHENIQYFGGDPDSITILGSDSGAASLSVLSVSPYAREYFDRGIQLGGSIMAGRMLSERTINKTWALAKQLNCDNFQPIDVKNCLKTKTLEEFFNAIDQLGSTRFEPNNILFNPRVDGVLLPKDYPYLVRETKPKTILTGFNTMEALANILINGNNSMSLFGIGSAEQTIFSENEFKNLIENIIAPETKYKESGAANAHKIAKIVQNEIFQYYCNNFVGTFKTKDNHYYLERYAQILSDIMYILPIVWESLIMLQGNWRLYLYWNAHVNMQSFPDYVKIRGLLLPKISVSSIRNLYRSRISDGCYKKDKNYRIG